MRIVTAPFKWLLSGFSGKTSWEWLELLIVPVGLAVGAFYLETRVERRQEEIAATRYEQELQIADARAKQETLDNYLEKMQELLLDRSLRDADEDSEVRSVARAITTTAIKELGHERNALLTEFLRQARLIQSPEKLQGESITLLTVIDLSNTKLRNAKLEKANLFFTNLSGSDLNGANLGSTDLTYTNLSNANLSDANLNDAHLSSTNLDSASLVKASLIRADLDSASLANADLREANMYEADLSNVLGVTREQLSEAHLCKTKLPTIIDLNIDPDRDCK